MKTLSTYIILGTLFFSCNSPAQKNDGSSNGFAISKSEVEWKEQLSPEAYKVLRQASTERAFSSDLNKNKQEGTYLCAACESPLYTSDHKFDSGSGWPSFDRAIPNSVSTKNEGKLGITSIEVHCATCGGHLGHIFNDGPKETTGKRHCINGVALKFSEKMEKQNEYQVNKSDAEWREILDDKQYHILREKGTEYPNTGKYNLHFDDGLYTCGGCHAAIFNSENKFESDCGWPSFDNAIEGSVEEVRDTSHGMIRTEIVCASCGGHLGHVFNDGPTSTGQRYCINSLSLDFKEK